ncbi:YihY family inner membrane protein [Alcaligenaceae bacterium SJ-26]|nr:YihY family inner membrane protein [Alcaligenaceae bacterium SJ-26]
MTTTKTDVPASHRTAHRLAHLRQGLRFALARIDEARLTQVASSLTFTTVLAIVPLLAVVLSLFTAFPLFQQFQVALEEFLTHNLMPEIVSGNIMAYLNQFAQQASRLTAIGGIFLMVTSVMLMMTIDTVLNDIWHVRRQRPLTQRILVYWAILSLGPVLLGASLWVTAVLARESLGLVGELPFGTEIALKAIPLLLAGFAFAALFVVVPNRTVSWRDGLMGGFGTAIVLELMKTGFAAYLTRFPSYTVIYGAFAIVPIFLLWIYLSWLTVLFGALITANIPAVRTGRWRHQHQIGAAMVQSVAVLRALMQARQAPEVGLTLASLSQSLQLYPVDVQERLEQLAALNYVTHIQEDGKDRWALVCDPGTTTLGPLFDRLLLARHQPALARDPALRNALAGYLADPPHEPPLDEIMRSGTHTATEKLT